MRVQGPRRGRPVAPASVFATAAVSRFASALRSGLSQPPTLAGGLLQAGRAHVRDASPVPRVRLRRTWAGPRWVAALVRTARVCLCASGRQGLASVPRHHHGDHVRIRAQAVGAAVGDSNLPPRCCPTARRGSGAASSSVAQAGTTGRLPNPIATFRQSMTRRLWFFVTLR